MRFGPTEPYRARISARTTKLIAHSQPSGRRDGRPPTPPALPSCPFRERQPDGRRLAGGLPMGDHPSWRYVAEICRVCSVPYRC